MYAFHIAQPSTMATTVVANVVTSGTIRRRALASLGRAGGGARAGRSTTFACSDLVSASDMATSAGDDQDHQRQHDHVNGEDEQRRMPDMPQQAIRRHRPTQAEGDEPRRHHQQGDWRDVDTEQVDLEELQTGSPKSK